ncbi:MAG: hypothetical protein GYA61_05900 [Spirochaetales bacterium]|nr:hypothetical protein [Spirochaetales bacterium]
MKNVRFFLIVIFLIIFFLFFLSSESTNFFYEIVKDFNILSKIEKLNNFIIFYRNYEQVKQRYFIYGYDSEADKNYGFSPSNEFITTPPFFNDSRTAFAYGALYQGNDFVWYKDFKNNIAYKILYSISGKLSLLSLDKSHKNIIVGFDYLAPQQFLYISGVKEFYTYPLTSYPNIIETGFTYDEKYVYIIFKYENLFNCDILSLSEDPYHSSSYKPTVTKIFSNADEILFSNSNAIIIKEKDQYIFYDLKDYTKNKIESLSIIKDKNNDKNAIFLINGLIFNTDFEKVTIDSENKYIDLKLLTNYLKIGKNVFYSDDFLIVKDENSSFYIFEYIRTQKEFKYITTIGKDTKNFNLVASGEIILINKFEDKLLFLVYDSLVSTNSISILLFKKDEGKIDSLYQDNIYKIKKALNSKNGFAFLVMKAYTKGIFQELYFYSFSLKSIVKISGWENVLDTELDLLKRKLD